MPVLWILQTSTWSDMLEHARVRAVAAGEGAVDLLLAVLILLVGWVIARLVSRAAAPLLRAARFNDGARSMLDLPPGGAVRREPAQIAASAVFWILIVLAVMAAADTLGFDLSIAVSDRLHDVLPRVIVATLLLALGLVLAVVFGAATRRMFEGAGLRASRFRGQLVTVVLSIFAVLIALEQLGLAAQFIMSIVIILLAAAGLALGLSFGLGCRDLARDFVVEYLRSLDREGPQRPL